jgi:hypothetical protein
MMSTERGAFSSCSGSSSCTKGLGVAAEVISNQWLSNQFRKSASDYCFTDYRLLRSVGPPEPKPFEHEHDGNLDPDVVLGGSLSAGVAGIKDAARFD